MAGSGMDIKFFKEKVEALGKNAIEGYTLLSPMLQDECSFTYQAKTAGGLRILAKVYYSEHQVLQGYESSRKKLIMKDIEDRYANELKSVNHFNDWKHEKNESAEYNVINYLGPLTSTEFKGFEIEYAEGGDLQSYFDTRIKLKSQGHAEEPLLESTIRTLVKQLLNGVHTLNRAHIAHCDIRPENVLYTKEGTFKIMNLGLSKKFGNNGDAFQGTYGGIVSNDFSPPEGLGLTERGLLRRSSDCWPVSAIMFMLITDSHWPFLTTLSENHHSIKNAREQLKRIVKKAKPDISYEALDVMTALLGENVDKRPNAFWTATKAPWFKNDMRFKDSTAAWAQGAKDDDDDNCIVM